MKKIEKLVRKNATEAGTWEPTHYLSLKQARDANPGEYANHFRIATGEPVRSVIISDYPTIHKTRFSELGYWKVMDGCWQCVDLTGDKPSQIGTQYATKAELLANLEAYATEYGCENANPKPSLTPAYIQAIRLLDEAYAVLGMSQLSDIAVSMDIPLSDVLARFDEATRLWETEKDRTVFVQDNLRRAQIGGAHDPRNDRDN